MPKGKHSNHVKGSNHYRWNSGSIESADGYRKVRVGRDHPLADPNGYAYEHLLVVLSTDSPGAYLLRNNPEKYVIHHVNGDRKDNRLENLHVIERAEHNRIHNEERERNEKGQFVGKKAAGRMLDGREWNEFPGGE